MKTHKGIYYFKTTADAREWAKKNGWPTDRIIEYQIGYAIQAGINGNYAGPNINPKYWP